MNIVEIIALDNGAHRNQSWDNPSEVIEGWAIVPDELETENFPFGEIEVEDRTFTRDVVKTREVSNENGEVETEEYVEQEEYAVPYVTKWTALPIPEPEPKEEVPTQLDIIEAQVTYTAMMTDTLLEV